MFTCSFKTDNAAFEDVYINEAVAEVLARLASTLPYIHYRGNHIDCKIYDSNGNHIGNWSLTDD